MRHRKLSRTIGITAVAAALILALPAMLAWGMKVNGTNGPDTLAGTDGHDGSWRGPATTR